MTSNNDEDGSNSTKQFYRRVLESLNRAGIDYMIGGAFAFHCYTGIRRNTKDLDIFIRRQDFDRVSDSLGAAGFQTELTYPHWLGKIRDNGDLIDLIFSSGNGIASVDDEWFSHAMRATVLEVPVLLCPVEEKIWSKAFILERERYDGADVAHLIRARATRLDWRRLLRRFDPHWRVLLSHLTLFGFVYPAHRNLVPAWLMEELVGRLLREMRSAPPAEPICGGTLLSREQYLVDVREQGYIDARVEPIGNMSAEDTAQWTKAIDQ